MDKRIRKNDICSIGLPRCDYVFSSARTCFIAYGFEESSLEMSLLKKILEGKGIQPIEAGGTLSPGQNAFCAKICSNIITAQFCIVIINNDIKEGQEVPNANVNMEYGLMLGFNKYVIPFQRDNQALPFNVAGLDTIKYNNRNFESLASSAIELAIKQTLQDDTEKIEIDQVIESFLLDNELILSPVDNPGEMALFRMGSPVKFYLYHDFRGDRYTYIGNFSNLRLETIIKRIKLLDHILSSRSESVVYRSVSGIIEDNLAKQVFSILFQARIWVIVTSVEDKTTIEEIFTDSLKHELRVISLSEVKASRIEEMETGVKTSEDLPQK